MKKKDEIKTVTHEIFGELDILFLDGKEYFPAKEVATMLGYSNQRDAIKRHCKSEGIIPVSYVTTEGNSYEKKYLNEGNLYRLIIKSKLPDADIFESWVFDELLPSLRQDGIYITDSATDDQKMFHYKMLGITFDNYDIGKLKELYSRCIEFYSDKRLPYQRKMKGNRKDKKHSIANTKIMVMKKIKETLENRELEHRTKGEFAHVSLISDVIKQSIEDIKTIQHNKTKGKLAASNNKLITE